jgi:hypothetical protein
MHNALRASIIGAFLVTVPMALLPQLSAASTVQDGRSPAATVARQEQLPRSFVARLNIYGRDDENWPDTDENVNRDYGPFQAVMEDSRPDYTFQIPALGWGGECRVEVDGINAHLQPDGSIWFHGFARLYEGTSENTSNLRAAKELNAIIPRKSSGFRYEEHLTWDGGDFADIKWSFDNVVNE